MPLISTREPILFEKLLELLYKSDYTVPKQPSTKPVTASGARAFSKAQLAKIAVDTIGTAQLTESGLGETEEPERLEEFEQLGDELVELEGKVEEDTILHDDTFLEECHPCYFHARMYVEAGWWKVQDLKAKTKSHFTKAFMDDLDPKSFSKTIEAIYAPNADCAELKDEVIKFIVPNMMMMLWKGAGVSTPPPVLTRELMERVPQFMLELFPKFLNGWCDKDISSQLAEKNLLVVQILGK